MSQNFSIADNWCCEEKRLRTTDKDRWLKVRIGLGLIYCRKTYLEAMFGRSIFPTRIFVAL